MKGKKTGYTLKEALKRDYKVRRLSVGGAIYVPRSLIGKRVKLRLTK